MACREYLLHDFLQLLWVLPAIAQLEVDVSCRGTSYQFLYAEDFRCIHHGRCERRSTYHYLSERLAIVLEAHLLLQRFAARACGVVHRSG